MVDINFKKISVFLICSCFSISLFSQNNKHISDSLLLKKHNPRTATIMSLCLPGLGQVYNRKYWKVPLVYAGFAAFGYFFNINNLKYKDFRSAYQFASGDSANRILNNNSMGYYKKYSVDGLKQGKDYYKRNRDLCVLLFGVWYALNIVDASVDANLFNYDINEDISLQLKPVFSNYAGLSLTLHLGKRKLY